MTDPDRIAQFQNMVESDPENELGHFSLGKALLDAQRYAEAAREFWRTVELNSGMSKAYHLLGMALDESGDREGAIEALKRGYKVAVERGDNMPRGDMAALLESFGVTVEAPVSEAPRQRETTDTGFRCQRCGQPNQPLESPPMNDDLGREIQAKICVSCWKEWLATGIKVINELRLNLADPKAQATYDQSMREFLTL